jgi:hypothetical protein
MSGTDVCTRYRCVYALLILRMYANARSCRGAGTRAEVRDEKELLHRIMRMAGFGSPVKLEARAGPCDLERARAAREFVYRENQDDLHLAIAVPRGMPITSIRIQAKARDQGWCKDPLLGPWTWAELGWLDARGEEPFVAPADRIAMRRAADCIAGGARSSNKARTGPKAHRLLVYTNVQETQRKTRLWTSETWQQYDVTISGAQLRTLMALRPRGAASLAVWVRSQFGSWQHYVEDMSIGICCDEETAFGPSTFLPLLGIDYKTDLLGYLRRLRA